MSDMTTTSNTKPARCSEWTSNDRWPTKCPRPAAEGETMCKQHLAGKKRREANQKRWDAERTAKDARLGKLQDQARRIQEYGVRAYIVMNQSGSYHLAVDGEALLGVLSVTASELREVQP